MSRYAALLRGINVGGQNRIAMADLRAWVEDLGHTDVATYINSGNVVFAAADQAGVEGLAAGIAGRIAAASGLSIPVLVRSGRQLADAVEQNPFPDADPSKLIIAFMQDPPAEETVRGWAAVDSGADVIVAVGSEVYLHCPDGLGRSRLGARLLRAGGPLGTTRNLRTLRKLAEMTARA